MKDDLFGRIVIVNVDGNELIGFDLDAEVVLTSEPQPNKCKIKIYNLPPDFQVACRKKDARVALQAGYEGTGFSQLFLGDIRYAPSGLNDADWVTQIEAGDGENSYRDSKVKITWTKGKPVSKVVEEILATFEALDIGDFNETFKADVQEQFPNGGALSGNSARVLDELVRGYGFRFSIQSGKFQFTTIDGENQQVAVQLSPQSGLIEEPEIGEKDKTTGKAKVKITALLQPKIIPGHKVVVSGTGDSGAKDGTYTVDKVTHQISNWQEKPFYTVMEALTK